MKPFRPNLDPTRIDEEEFAFIHSAEKRAAVNELLDDTMRDYCSNCNGRGYTVEFGVKQPCTKGLKIMRQHPPRIVCYAPETPNRLDSPFVKQ